MQKGNNFLPPHPRTNLLIKAMGLSYVGAQGSAVSSTHDTNGWIDAANKWVCVLKPGVRHWSVPRSSIFCRPEIWIPEPRWVATSSTQTWRHTTTGRRIVVISADVWFSTNEKRSIYVYWSCSLIYWDDVVLVFFLF